MTNFRWPALQPWSAHARVSNFSLSCLLSSLARGTRPGRGLWTRRNFPDVWYKSKKKEKCPHFDHRTCRDVLSVC